MSDRRTDLAERRAVLLLRTAVQRREVAREFEALEARLHLADHYLAVGRRIVLHPLVITSTVVVIALIGRGRAFQLLGRTLLLSRGLRSLLHLARGRS
jgi:hypothetical protein